MTDNPRCTNYPSGTGMRLPQRCVRTPIEGESLCRICKAARERGKQKADKRYNANLEIYQLHERLNDARANLVLMARLWRHDKATDLELIAAIDKLEGFLATKTVERA